ncbi:uncharacterized protein LOC129917196 [Episyrphus balteatus]|uniref:uncharacterized protein LOC129917196 n=1 Tax=Episyrphus balteatus TaxID=286459 RepID=UPI0024857A7A|nr:uncharacterized protein LOC129917196 [Episyrphus balteatus]
MFRVVETIENGERFVTAVPRNWVDGSTLLWPNTKKDLLTGRKQCLTPSEDWQKLKCRLIFDDIDSWDEAIAKEKEAEFMSSDETGLDELGKLPENAISDLNLLMSEIICENLCAPPKMHYGSSTNTLSYDSDQQGTSQSQSQSQSFESLQAENKAAFQSIEVSLGELKAESGLQKKLLEEFIARTEVTLNTIIDKLCQRRESAGELKIPENLLPISTHEQLDSLEEKIGTDPAFRRSLIRKLSTFGGLSASKTMRTISKCMFGDELLAQYSWYGTNSKKKFDSYKLIFEVVVEAVRERFPSFSDTEGASYMKTYLKQARFRQGKNPLDDSTAAD